MTVTDTSLSSAVALGFGIFDADQHYYEAEDALTRFLPKEFKNSVRWVDVGRRRTLLLNDKLLTIIPNPTYDPVGAPGSLEVYFRSQNHEGRELRDIVKMQEIQPEYRDREARIDRLDEQGVDFAWLIPSLGLGLEEFFADDPKTLVAIFESYNRWLDDDWGYDRDGRIQTGPMITLVDPIAAEAELERVIDLGAKMICMRPAPVAVPGTPKSPGDPIHDRIWARCAEAGVVVAMHAADSGYGKYTADWGEDTRYTGMKASPLTEVMSVHIERPIFDTMAAFVCHGVFDRHPKLKVATLELGAAWVPDLLRRFKASYGKTPQAFGQDPVESFREHVWVAPFYEDNLTESIEALGEDHIMLGSDWPHPEGLATPSDAVADFGPLGEDLVRKAMRDNLANLVGLG